MMKKVALIKLSVCPCGFTLLADSIPLGTEYTIDTETIGNEFSYRCGRCGTIHRNMASVRTSQSLHPERPMAPLPLELFMTTPSGALEVIQ